MYEEIEQSMYELICRFTSRQNLVFQVLKELRPRILISTGAITGENLEKSLRFNIPQSGYWGTNQEWKYFIHGLGCKLVHTTTEEPIEWNAPDVKAFDKYWFVNWIKWYLKQPSEVHNLTSKPVNPNGLDEFIDLGLLKLEQKGIIVHSSSQYANEYVLSQPL